MSLIRREQSLDQHQLQRNNNIGCDTQFPKYLLPCKPRLSPMSPSTTNSSDVKRQPSADTCPLPAFHLSPKSSQSAKSSRYFFSYPYSKLEAFSLSPTSQSQPDAPPKCRPTKRGPNASQSLAPLLNHDLEEVPKAYISSNSINQRELSISASSSSSSRSLSLDYSSPPPAPTGSKPPSQQPVRKRRQVYEAGPSGSGKRFACSFPGCTKTSARPSALETHMRTHTKEKPFKCPLSTCNRGFSVYSNMVRHQRLCNHPTPIVEEAFPRPSAKAGELPPESSQSAFTSSL
ncbi:hypothetical protein T439DRAFT_328556 [Meredithblackwellia eburnea MCA 4105]